MMKRYWRRLAGLASDETGTTVEWLLVTGVTTMVSVAVGWGATVMLAYIFSRTALVIALPFG
jgi:hypothetical protein